MIKQNFQLDALRRYTLLIISYDDETYAFGLDYMARILEFQISDKTYLSRSYYLSKINIYEDWAYEEKTIEVPEKESDLARSLLFETAFEPEMIGVICEITKMNMALCRKCKGKGFTDWVEDIIEPQWDTRCSEEELKTTRSIMKPLFTQFAFHNNVSAFYKNRKLENEYIQECQLCEECSGVGFDNAFLERYIPDSIIINLFRMVKYHNLKSY